MGKEIDKAFQMLRDMKCVQVVSPEKGKKRKCQEKESAASASTEGRESSTSIDANNTHTILQPAKKRGRPPKSSSNP